MIATSLGLPLVRTGTPFAVTQALSPSTMVAWIVYVADGSMTAEPRSSENETGTELMSRSISEATIELSVTRADPSTSATTAKASPVSAYGSR